MSAATLREAADTIRDDWGSGYGSAWHRVQAFHLAVADWLDGLADAMTNPDAPDGSVSTDREERRAFVVARAYLGEPS